MAEAWASCEGRLDMCAGQGGSGEDERGKLRGCAAAMRADSFCSLSCAKRFFEMAAWTWDCVWCVCVCVCVYVRKNVSKMDLTTNTKHRRPRLLHAMQGLVCL